MVVITVNLIFMNCASWPVSYTHLDVYKRQILDFTEQRQLCWWGHMQRMDSDRMVKQVWEVKSGGERREEDRDRLGME